MHSCLGSYHTDSHSQRGMRSECGLKLPPPPWRCVSIVIEPDRRVGPPRSWSYRPYTDPAITGPQMAADFPILMSIPTRSLTPAHLLRTFSCSPCVLWSFMLVGLLLRFL